MSKSKFQLLHGDCLEVLKTLPDSSVDSVVTDPPYELGFMGKKWDSTGIANNVELWREVLRVLKPGGHLLAFSGSRTYHRMTCAIEDAGFEVRDQMMWVYGSGFPKSLDVSKAIDKAAGAEGGRGPMKRGGERLARLCDGKRDGDGRWGDESGRDPFTYLPATEAARQWQGWGTALKPAHEPICVARKPLKGTVAANVLEHGTGALNIDACRVGTEKVTQHGRKDSANLAMSGRNYAEDAGREWEGRWPANLIHDGIEAPWARYFYCPKANKKDREEGLRGLAEREICPNDHPTLSRKDRNHPTRQNHHPTVKPTELMRYLCSLVTPPSGVVLDPFMGSGSTGKAAMLEGFRFIGIEREAEYLAIARARISHAHGEVSSHETSEENQKDLFSA